MLCSNYNNKQGFPATYFRENLLRGVLKRQNIFETHTTNASVRFRGVSPFSGGSTFAPFFLVGLAFAAAESLLVFFVRIGCVFLASESSGGKTLHISACPDLLAGFRRIGFGVAGSVLFPNKGEFLVVFFPFSVSFWFRFVVLRL